MYFHFYSFIISEISFGFPFSIIRSLSSLPCLLCLTTYFKPCHECYSFHIISFSTLLFIPYLAFPTSIFLLYQVFSSLPSWFLPYFAFSFLPSFFSLPRFFSPTALFFPASLFLPYPAFSSLPHIFFHPLFLPFQFFFFLASLFLHYLGFSSSPLIFLFCRACAHLSAQLFFHASLSSSRVLNLVPFFGKLSPNCPSTLA